MNDENKDFGHFPLSDTKTNNEKYIGQTLEKAMNTHALLNVNTLLRFIEQGRVSELETYLMEYLHQGKRDVVLSDQEMILALSRVMVETAHEKDDLTDKMCRMFWQRTQTIFKTHGVI